MLTFFITVAINNVFCFFTTMVILTLATYTPREKQNERTRMSSLCVLILLKVNLRTLISFNKILIFP